MRKEVLTRDEEVEFQGFRRILREWNKRKAEEIRPRKVRMTEKVERGVSQKTEVGKQA